MVKDSCKCGSQVRQVKCQASATLYNWKHGIHYENEGYHSHPRPSHILHLLPDEKNHFQDIVKQHPNAKPLELLVGPTELGGPGKSVADISPVLCNADRISKEREKVKKMTYAHGGDGFLASFAAFDREHAGFKIFSIIGDVTVICLQSPLMRKQLVKDDLLDENINGMVNDAAHGWWRDKNALLMVTSTYCPELFCWVPGVLSYTNGASAEHFKHHFLAVFNSIADEALSRSIEVTDRLFAGVRHLHLCFSSKFDC